MRKRVRNFDTTFNQIKLKMSKNTMAPVAAGEQLM